MHSRLNLIFNCLPVLWQSVSGFLLVCASGKLHTLAENKFVVHPIPASLRPAGNRVSSFVLKILDNCNKMQNSIFLHTILTISTKNSECEF